MAGGLGEISRVWWILTKTEKMGTFLAYKRKSI
jgi:hypothetical protein